MLKEDHQELNYYSMSSRAKQKHSIASLYLLIHKNTQSLKNSHIINTIMSPLRKGSLKKSPVKLLDEGHKKRNQQSVSKHKGSIALQNNQRKVKIVNLKSSKKDCLDQIYIHSSSPIQKEIKIKRSLQENKSIQLYNSLEEQINEKLFKTQTQHAIYFKSDPSAEIQKSQQINFVSKETQCNIANQELHIQNIGQHQKDKDIPQDLPIQEQRDVQQLNNKTKDNYESVVLDKLNMNLQLQAQNEAQNFIESNHVVSKSKSQQDFCEEQQNFKQQAVNMPQSQNQHQVYNLQIQNVLQPINNHQDNYVETENLNFQIQSVPFQQNQFVNQFLAQNSTPIQCTDIQKLNLIKQQDRVHEYNYNDQIYIQKNNAADLAQQKSKSNKQIDEQEFNEFHNAIEQQDSFKNVFCSNANCEQDKSPVSAPAPLTQPSQLFAVQQAKESISELNGGSDDFNYTPLTLELKTQKNQTKNTNKIIFKKLLVGSKLHLNPKLATSKIFTQKAKQADNKKDHSNKIEVKSASVVNQQSAVDSSKTNFKSMIQRNRNSPQASPDSKPNLSPSKNSMKSSSNNLKLLIGFFQQN